MRRAEAGPMRKKGHQIAGDRLKLAQSVADKAFVADGGSGTGSNVVHETFPGSFEGTPAIGAGPSSGNDSPSTLRTKQREKPKETSTPRQNRAVRHRDREVVGDQTKPAPSAADETLLTEQQLAARWQVSPKTLRNARLQGRLVSFVKLGRLIRYRLSTVISVEEQNSVRSTSGRDE